MSEIGLFHLRSLPKHDAYQEASKALLSVLEGEQDQTTKMAVTACLLAQAFEPWFWVGFYCVAPSMKEENINELVLGPFVGTLGCLRIGFGRGVCGAAAQTKKVQIVEDVHAFDGHIACDSRSNSEIVVPVFDKNDELIAVFDVDSENFSAFDETDALELQKLLKAIFGT